MSALETYVTQFGIHGAIAQFANRAKREKNLNLKEFFINCKNFLYKNSEKFSIADTHFKRMNNV